MRRISHDNINTQKYWSDYYSNTKTPEGIDWLKNSVIANHIIDNSRVLEIGFGQGWLLSRIATQHPNTKLFGAEFSDAAIKNLEKDARITKIKADLNDDIFLREYEGSFDYVICCEVLEHLEKPGKLFKDISQLLIKGGVVILTTPFGDHIPSPEHVWEFSMEDIEEMMKGNFSQYWVYPWASGLEVHEVKTGRIIYPAGHLDVIWAVGIK